MSGADCGSGCTDCPTCRGEVQPDSPAMHDMNFAMAMEKGALPDRLLGPLRVAQTVRGGIRSRGATHPDDAKMLAHVNGVTGALAGRSAVAPRHEKLNPQGDSHGAHSTGHGTNLMPSGISFDQNAPPPGFWPFPPGITLEVLLMHLRRLFNIRGTPKHFAKLSAEEAGAIRFGSRSVGSKMFEFLNPPEDWLPGGGGAECCVKDFNYPVGAPTYWMNISQIGAEFLFGAQYSNIFPCSCSCCYFAQYALGERRKTLAFFGTSVEVFPLTEDCRVVDRNGNNKGNTVEGVRPTEPGDRVQCYPPRAGDRRSDVLMSNSCMWTDHDEPAVGRDPFRAISASWHFLGVVYDVCNNWSIKAIDSFDMRVYAGGWLSIAASGSGEWRHIGRGQTAWVPMRRTN